MTIRNVKVLSLALTGVMVAATAAAPMTVHAAAKENVRAPKVNVTKFLFNSKGPVVIKDLLRVTQKATFKKNVNVLQNLTVSGATALQGLSVAGDLNVENVKFAGTADVSEMDTGTLVGGEVYYDEEDKKLYLWNATEWLDLSAEANESSVGDNMDLVLDAAESRTIDAATTDSTTTSGVLDIDVDAGNAAVDGLNLDVEQADGATAGTDVTAQEVSLTANDADGDMFGLAITGAATTNAGAGSYEAGVKIANAENTAGAMVDALLVTTTSGTAGDIIDAIDASAADITNALNIGANTITGTTGMIDFTDFDVDADGLITTASDGAGVGLTLGGTALTTDISLQNGETIDNDTNGTIALGGNVAVTGSISPEAASTRDLGSTSAEFDDIFVGDGNGLNMGLAQNAELAYDAATDGRVELTGTGAGLYVEDRLTLGRQDVDIADNGSGTPATQAFTPSSSYVVMSCADANGCQITISEASAKDGDVLTIISDEGSSSFIDSVGVTELTGVVNLGQWDSLKLQYVTDRWVQISTANN